RLGHEAGIVEQLIALKNALVGPRPGLEAEGELDAFLAELPKGFATRTRPCLQRGLDDIKRLGSAVAPILPWKIIVPVLPRGMGKAGGARLLHEGEVGDRERMPRIRVMGFGPVSVAEGVKLLHVTQGELRLLGNPAAQPHLKRAMLRLQRA